MVSLIRSMRQAIPHEDELILLRKYKNMLSVKRKDNLIMIRCQRHTSTDALNDGQQLIQIDRMRFKVIP